MQEAYKIIKVINKNLAQSEISIRATDYEVANQIELLIKTALKPQSDQLAIKVEDAYHFITKSQIIYAEVNQGILTIETPTKSYDTRQSLSWLKQQLIVSDYIQVSKSALVRIDAIERLEAAFSGNLYAFLTTSKKIVVSRRFVIELKKHLGL